MKYYAVSFRFCYPSTPSANPSVEATPSVGLSRTDQETAWDILAAIVGEAGFESFTDISEGTIGYIQQDQFNETFLRTLLDDFPMQNVRVTFTVSPAEDRDWNETWENAGFDPIFIGERCVIYDARRLETAPLSSFIAPLRIGIEAEMAFGTGTHETTRLMVAQLLDLDLTDKRVLDCGCGTGILGIAASKLGASEVVAYDIDEWSVKNTRHNAELNEVANLQVLHGDSRVLTHVSGVFDVVVANINRNILLADLPHFADVLSSSGQLLLSGFYQDGAHLLVAEAEKLGLHLQAETAENHWGCLKFGR